MIRFTQKFLQNESSSGIILMIVTVLVLLISNSSLAHLYHSILHIDIEVRFADFSINKHLYHWVNDGLMAIFFLLIGIEVKREILEGDLSSWKRAVLPLVAAVGGVVMPASIYILLNYSHDIAIDGWAIATATDVAFALAVFTLLSKNVPSSLKIFLLSLAIIDDICAIVIIAFFYSAELSTISFIVAGTCCLVLIIFNYFGVARKMAYILVGLVLWVSVLKSGVHATLAGVVLAFCIPIEQTTSSGSKVAVSESFEEDIQYWVNYLILPLFVFVNAGITLSDLPMGQFISMPVVGIILGLFIGKQVGVFGFSWIAIKLGFAELPKGSSWMQLYGVSVLTGIGFTMSLFINSLAFPNTDLFEEMNKLAILIGSFASGIVGYLILLKSGSK
jgi:NhaA family Na+:H+ antiporter